MDDTTYEALNLRLVFKRKCRLIISEDEITVVRDKKSESSFLFKMSKSDIRKIRVSPWIGLMSISKNRFSSKVFEISEKKIPALMSLVFIAAPIIVLISIFLNDYLKLFESKLDKYLILCIICLLLMMVFRFAYGVLTRKRRKASGQMDQLIHQIKDDPVLSSKLKIEKVPF